MLIIYAHKQALKKEQLKNQKLSEHNKRFSNGKALASGKSSDKRSKKVVEGFPEGFTNEVDQIACLGKKSAVMLCPWIPPKAFCQQQPLMDHLDISRRYANKRNKEMGLIAELYDFVHVSYHEYLLGLPKFGEIVSITYQPLFFH